LCGYNTYDAYSPFKYAQPHTDPIFVHPNSAATQLGLTQEEIREVLEDQERWMREEHMMEEQGMHAPTTTTQYQQDSTPTHTPSISNSNPTPQAHEMPDKPPEDATSPYNDGPLDPKFAPCLLYQPPSQSCGTCPYYLMTVCTM
jgi:hypothetical protein